jgi:hypothetical protein
MADPIATYSETTFLQKRFFALADDSIQVNGKSFNTRFETNIPLALLNPVPEKAWIRNADFNTGISLCLLAVFMLFVASLALSNVIELPAIARIATVVFTAALGIAGIVLLARNWRKVEWVRFKNSSEIVILDLAKSGKQKANFDKFVTLLTDQIRAQKPVQKTNPP